MQFLIQLPSAYKHGLRFRFEIDFSHPGLRETLRLVAPFVLSAAASQVNLIVDRTLATGLPAGIVSSLYFANKLVFLPQNIFTGAVAMVVFPVLTRAAARREWGELIEGFQRSVRLLSPVLLPATMGIFVLRLPLVRLLFEHGAFTHEDTVITAGMVGYFLGALYFGAMAAMVSNIYFALKKMVVAVWTGLIAVAVNIGLCLLTAGLFVVLRQHGIQANPLQGIGKFLGQVIIAVTGMSVLVNGYLHLIGPRFSGKSGLMVVVFSAVVLGAVVYAILCPLLR